MRATLLFFAFLVSGCGHPSSDTYTDDGGSADGTARDDGNAAIGWHDRDGAAPMVDGSPDATNVTASDLTTGAADLTTRATVDLASSTSPDLLAVASCGAPGQRCCPGGACNTGSACANWGGSDTYCAACGQAGEACCGTGSPCDVGLACKALVSPGNSYEILTCVNSAPGNVPGGTCPGLVGLCDNSTDLTCFGDATHPFHCAYCGGPGQPGCVGGSPSPCQVGLDYLATTASVIICTSQCGHFGEPCCGGQRCLDGSACHAVTCG